MDKFASRLADSIALSAAKKTGQKTGIPRRSLH
jgi:hypothetical protein